MHRWIACKPILLLFATLVVALFLVGACGAPAKPEAKPEQKPPAAGIAPTKAAPAAPVATPAAAAVPAGPVGAGKKVVLLVTNYGNGRMDPLLADGEDLKYQRMFNQALVGGKGGSVITPGIAKKWEMSPDGKTWTFTINEGFIKFHNGQTLTAKDVFFSFDSRIGKEGKELLAKGFYEPRDVADFTNPQRGVENVGYIPGTDKVSVTWKVPRPDFAFNWSENSQGPTPMITPEAHVRKLGGTKGFEGYEQEPVGAGPFRVTKYVPKQRYEFERFNDYFWHPGNGYDEDRRAKFQFLVMDLVPEGSTRAAALQAGDADIIEANLLMIKDIEKAGGRVVWQDESAYNWNVFVDCWEPAMWCYKKEVRQALDYAIDKQTIVNKLYGRAASVKGWGHVTANALGYTPDLDPYPHDLKKAKQLLEQAGFPGGRGIPPFKIWTWEAGDTPFLPELSQLFADTWKKDLGLQVEVSVGDSNSVRQKWNNRQLPGDVLVRTNEARYDGTSIIIGGWTNPDIAWRVVKHPDQEPWASTSVPAAKKAINDINTATRHQTFNETYKYLRDEHVWWSAFTTNLPWGIGAKVKDYRPWSLVPYVTAIWTVELK